MAGGPVLVAAGVRKHFGALAALGGVDLKIPPRTFSNRPLPKFD